MEERRKQDLTAEADGIIEGRNAVIEALRAGASAAPAPSRSMFSRMRVELMSSRWVGSCSWMMRPERLSIRLPARSDSDIRADRRLTRRQKREIRMPWSSRVRRLADPSMISASAV